VGGQLPGELDLGQVTGSGRHGKIDAGGPLLPLLAFLTVTVKG
jgi:hypothetical protein